MNERIRVGIYSVAFAFAVVAAVVGLAIHGQWMFVIGLCVAPGSWLVDKYIVLPIAAHLNTPQAKQYREERVKQWIRMGLLPATYEETARKRLDRNVVWIYYGGAVWALCCSALFLLGAILTPGL